MKQLKGAHREGRYQQLCLEAQEVSCQEQSGGNRPSDGNGNFATIERDLGRTFPRHTMFESNSDGVRESGGESLGIGRLRRLLRAYSLYDPEVGYCQVTIYPSNNQLPNCFCFVSVVIF